MSTANAKPHSKTTKTPPKHRNKVDSRAASMDNFKEKNKCFYTYELNKQIKKVSEVYRTVLFKYLKI